MNLWREHFRTRKLKDARPDHKKLAFERTVNIIEAGELQELTPGENIISYDTDGSMAGVVVWDFIQGVSTPTGSRTSQVIGSKQSKPTTDMAP